MKNGVRLAESEPDADQKRPEVFAASREAAVPEAAVPTRSRRPDSRRRTDSRPETCPGVRRRLV